MQLPYFDIIHGFIKNLTARYDVHGAHIPEPRAKCGHAVVRIAKNTNRANAIFFFATNLYGT